MEARSSHYDPSTPQERSERESEFARIIAFTDGVLAIAITLLVLQLQVPQDSTDLTKDLLDQAPDLIAYGLSFAVIGRFWMLHHRFFARLARFDSRLMILNLIYLGLIVLVPFTSEVLGDYGDKVQAPVVYALSLGGAALMNWLMVRHALRRELIDPVSRPVAESYGGLYALTIPGIFFVSIPIAFISPIAAEASWLVLFLVRGTLPRKS